MKTTVTTRHISENQNSEELKTYALKKAKRIEKYLKSEREPSELRFVLSSEKFRDAAEITVNSANVKAASSVEMDDMHAAIDGAVDSIVRQINKQTDKKIKSKRRVSARPKEDTDEIVNETDSPSIQLADIKVHKLPSKPMSIEEASLQLRVSDANFIAFKNSENDKMNVLYLNRRGQAILIEP